MVLRVTARRAQRLGTMAPSQTPCTANRACGPCCCGKEPGPVGKAALAWRSAAAPSASSTRRCSTKCAVRETVPPAMVAWNCGRVFSLCMQAPRLEPGGTSREQAGSRPETVAALAGQALAALGAACVDNGTAAASLHADEETVGARAARLGGLISTFHGAIP